MQSDNPIDLHVSATCCVMARKVPEVCSTFFRLDDDFAIEVAQHPLGSPLGTIDGYNAEVLRPNRFHSVLN